MLLLNWLAFEKRQFLALFLELKKSTFYLQFQEKGCHKVVFSCTRVLYVQLWYKEEEKTCIGGVL